MTGQELRRWLDQRPFQIFEIEMDNGDTFEVRHQELAKISGDGALYIFQPLEDPIADVSGPQTVCEIRNISTIHPISLNAS